MLKHPGKGLRAIFFFACLGLIQATATAADQSSDASLARVLQRGVLRWGGDLQGGEPYVFRDPTDPTRLLGFEVELLEAVARELGVRAEFVQNDWSTLLSSLERGNFDVAVNGIEVTSQRARAFALTRPYASFRESLIVRLEDAYRVRGLADLQEKRVGTLANSLAHEILRSQTDVRLVLYEGVDEPLTDLEVSRIDAVVIDDVIARRYLPRHARLVEAAQIGSGTYAMVLRPQDSALQQAISQALDSLEQRGELPAILRRWGIEPARGLPHIGDQTAAPINLANQAALFLRAAAVTLLLSTLAMGVAVGFGFILSIAREYGNPLIGAVVQGYVELFRGTPVLLQLYVLYYGLARLIAIDAFTTAVVGLGMNYAAYEAELYRAGFRAVAKGQQEAALALGMSRWLALRRILMPQAVRVALPGTANDFIALLKDSSIVSVITVVELTKQMTITAVDVRSWLLPGLLCAALYMAMSLPLSRLARRLEQKLGKGQ
ncbi:MAG: ABC transporter substrate-binding protein/permease [Candidatus Binatia bacterium]|nr:ABC transporter substrate-binding protein/permease [Candidatus Binatia bacterium]